MALEASVRDRRAAAVIDLWGEVTAAGAAALLAGRVKNGGQGVWGQIPMPANATIPEDDIRRIVGWILDGAP